MEFTMQAGGVPAGQYAVEFAGAEPYREKVEKYGEGVLLKWRVLAGDHTGEIASRICSARLTQQSNLAKFAVAIAGRQIVQGERFDFAPYVGTRGMVICEAREGGGSRVASFIREQGLTHSVPPSQAPPPQVSPSAPTQAPSYPPTTPSALPPPPASQQVPSHQPPPPAEQQVVARI